MQWGQGVDAAIARDIDWSRADELGINPSYVCNEMVRGGCGRIEFRISQHDGRADFTASIGGRRN